MANGQVALVSTEGLRSERSTRVVYFVAEEDPAKAETIIGAIMAPNERVEAWGPLPEAAVKAIGLKPGEFRRLPRHANFARREDQVQLRDLDTEKPLVISGVRARQDVTGHNVRYFLAFGLASAIIALTLVYLFYFDLSWRIYLP
jgi:hypothetical protein